MKIEEKIIEYKEERKTGFHDPEHHYVLWGKISALEWAIRLMD